MNELYVINRTIDGRKKVFASKHDVWFHFSQTYLPNYTPALEDWQLVTLADGIYVDALEDARNIRSSKIADIVSFRHVLGDLFLLLSNIEEVGIGPSGLGERVAMAYLAGEEGEWLGLWMDEVATHDGYLFWHKLLRWEVGFNVGGNAGDEPLSCIPCPGWRNLMKAGIFDSLEPIHMRTVMRDVQRRFGSTYPKVEVFKTALRFTQKDNAVAWMIEWLDQNFRKCFEEREEMDKDRGLDKWRDAYEDALF